MRCPEISAFLFLDRIPQPARHSQAKLLVRKIGYNYFLRKEFFTDGNENSRESQRGF